MPLSCSHACLQVGVCSGMVLGFLATVLAVHLIMSRRPGSFPSKGSTSPVGNYSASILSPGDPSSLASCFRERESTLHACALLTPCHACREHAASPCAASQHSKSERGCAACLSAWSHGEGNLGHVFVLVDIPFIFMCAAHRAAACWHTGCCRKTCHDCVMMALWCWSSKRTSSRFCELCSRHASDTYCTGSDF